MDEALLKLLPVVLFGLAAWLGKLWLARQLAIERLALEKDMAGFRASSDKSLKEFQSELDATKVKLSAALQHSVHVERVQFEHEFAIYKQVWEKLVPLRMVTMRLRPLLDERPANESQEDTMRKRIAAFVPAFEAFRDVVETNKPFDASDVYACLDAVMTQCYSERIDYEHVERGSADYFKEAKENRELIAAAIDATCEAIRSRISQVKVVAS